MIIYPRNKTSSHFQIISFLKYSKVCLIVIMQTIAFVYSKLLSWTKKHADVAQSVSRGLLSCRVASLIPVIPSKTVSTRGGRLPYGSDGDPG